MKKHLFLSALSFNFVLQIAALIFFAFQRTDSTQDAVLVNEAVQTVQADWNRLEYHDNQTNLDYVVLDLDGTVLFQTKPGLSQSVNMAVVRRDTILDIATDGSLSGKIIIANDSAHHFETQKHMLMLSLAAATFFECALCIGYHFYLNHTIIKPFHHLKGFAERIADGNLNIPLTMDRHNLFGAFTESFDIMRTELKHARMAEAKANADKKELVAKLSHDIKTPIASIKAASEVGAALTQDEKIRENYTQIILKADQINALISNLFSATLEELKQLSVCPADLESANLKNMLANADYLHRARIPSVPDCILYADSLRLQQVFDNIFANSYKYANTEIAVAIYQENNRLTVTLEDRGGGVKSEELPLLKEKFKRGSNARHLEGAGLGLYISDYFMREMQGGLSLENGTHGLKVIVSISLSGRQQI